MPSGQPTSAPSGQPSAKPSVAPTTFPYLDYAPNIDGISVEIDPGEYSATLRVLVEGPCVVYCGVFPASGNPSLAISALDIYFQRIRQFTFFNHVNITLASITPSVHYEAYCLTTSLDGHFEMSLANILDTKTDVIIRSRRKDLVVDLESRVYSLDSVVQEVAQLTFDPRVNVFIPIHVSISLTPRAFFLEERSTRKLEYLSTAAETDPSQCLDGITVIPDAFIINNSSSATDMSIQSIEIGSRCPGTFLLNISAYEIDSNQQKHLLPLQFSNADSITIFSRNMSALTPPVPILAEFVSSGAEVELRFDSFTDCSGDVVGILFSCHKLLEFEGVLSTQCYWKTKSRLRLKRPLSLIPESNVTLFGGLVGSALNSTVISMASSTLKVGFGRKVQPIVVVNAPKTVSSCSPFELDLTSSSGNGGRLWSVINVVVWSYDADESNLINYSYESDINEFYRDVYSLPEVTPLPTGMMVDRRLYFFDIELCNFLGGCTSYVHRVSTVSNISQSVSIMGESHRSGYRNEFIRLKAQPSLSCNDTEMSWLEYFSRYLPVYQWQVFDTSSNLDIPVLSLTSTDSYSSSLKIAPYTLTAGIKYQVVTTLSVLESGVDVSFMDVAYLDIRKGPLRALISPSGYTSILMGEVIRLNATDSYDSNDIKDNQKLLFDWTCSTQNVNNNIYGCHDIISVTNSGKSLIFDSRKSFPGAKHRVSLRLSSSLDSRTDVMSVWVSVEESCCSKVTIPPIGRVNPQKEFDLDGYVESSLSGVATWSLPDLGWDLSKITSSPPSLNLFSLFESPSLNVLHLLIDPYTLSGGASYKFQLEFVSQDLSDYSSSSVLVEVNDIPQPGEFLASPRSGHEMQTLFSVVALYWTDPDIPLQYTFGYRGLIKPHVVSDKSDENKAQMILPSGTIPMNTSNYSLSLFVYVFDSLEAFGNATDQVIVNSDAFNSTSSLNVEDLFKDSILNESTGAIPYLNCSMSPDCSALNRESCSEIHHTCGPCLDGNFIGVPGHSNTYCLNSTLIPSDAEYCDGANPCNSFKHCVDNVCYHKMKECTPSCGLHGVCSFQNVSTGNTITSCVLADLDECEALCICNDRYYGDNCDIPGILVISLVNH